MNIRSCYSPVSSCCAGGIGGATVGKLVEFARRHNGEFLEFSQHLATDRRHHLGHIGQPRPNSPTDIGGDRDIARGANRRVGTRQYPSARRALQRRRQRNTPTSRWAHRYFTGATKNADWRGWRSMMKVPNTSPESSDLQGSLGAQVTEEELGMMARGKAFAGRFVLFFAASFTLAAGVYGLILEVFSSSAFIALYRMYTYHWSHPWAYIALPCMTWSIGAAVFAPMLARMGMAARIAWTLALAAGAVFAASPLGGMLWYYHDMQAGFFPIGWQTKLLREGVVHGLDGGWLIVGLSFPYNIIGAAVSLELVRIGGRLAVPGHGLLWRRATLRICWVTFVTTALTCVSFVASSREWLPYDVAGTISLLACIGSVVLFQRTKSVLK